jgi:hypothetical protein
VCFHSFRVGTNRDKLSAVRCRLEHAHGDKNLVMCLARWNYEVEFCLHFGAGRLC